MERIINFIKEDNKYVFQEMDKENKIEIDEVEKTLKGLDLYNQFFKDYSIEDSYVLNDCTTEEDKANDKICLAIYKKISELFASIEESMKTRLNTSSDDLTESGTE